MHWPVWRACVTEHSMEPALCPGDRLLAWRGLRAGRPPRVRPGQLVVSGLPGNPDFLLVKRAKELLPDGWWLVSDNPVAGTADSYAFGPVPPGLIYARVLLRYRAARPATE
ncbi:MAG: S26 family signal peptidase [Actinobacteria bacterium]|nr:S26 family signal peptidase [Actinomycetota bacterium]